MSDQLKLINLDAPWRRILLLVPVALALTGVWFVVRWSMGNTLAEFPPDAETMRAAERLAPDDPQVHFTMAVLAKRSFAPEDLQEALRQYEVATSLSPHDFRFWMELGRARGQAGETDEGAQALRRAIELAPHYALPRWYLGNLLLRARREQEAFEEFRRAGDLDPTLRSQIASVVWNFYQGDVKQVAAAVGNSVPARAQLIQYLIQQKRLDEALHMWSGLNAVEQKEQHELGRKLIGGLFEAKRFHTGLDVQRAIAQTSSEAEVAPGLLANGGFEENILKAGMSQFGWQVTSLPQAQVGLDPRNVHSGTRSLRIIFNAPSMPGFGSVSQFVPVEPGARYRLEYFVRTADLKSASTLVTQILDVSQTPARALTSAAELPNGTRDWELVILEFTVPARSEGVSISLVRTPCPDDRCPIFGRVWYDDFNLQRLGGEARVGARGATAHTPGSSAGGRVKDTATTPR